MRLIEREGKQVSLHPVVLVVILAVGLVIGLLLPEGGVSWSLLGFEEHRFTVGEETISLRLDTSGAGRYGVELHDNRIDVIKDGEVLWEGGFVSAEKCTALRQKTLAVEDCCILEQGSQEGGASLVCGDPSGGEGYVFMTQIDGSGIGAVFHTPDGSALTGEEALEYARRLRFTKLD